MIEGGPKTGSTYVLQNNGCLRSPAFAVKSYHGAKPMLLPLGQFVLRMRTQPGVRHTIHCRMAFKKQRHCMCISVSYDNSENKGYANGEKIATDTYLPAASIRKCNVLRPR